MALIAAAITKQDTVMRQAIPPSLRLAITLHYLVTGEDHGSLHKHWQVRKSTACGIILETCQAIWDIMSPIYLQQPTTVEEWTQVAEGYVYTYERKYFFMFSLVDKLK